MRCPACGNDSKKKLVLIDEHSVKHNKDSFIYKIYQCLDCQSEFSDPMKSLPSEWFVNNTDNYYVDKWEFGELIKDSEKLSDDSRIIEIGCGPGHTLDKLKTKFNVCGLDFSSKAIEEVKSKGIEAYCDTLDEFIRKFPEKKFDAVNLFHIIEHLDNPMEFLSLVKRILNKNSTLFVAIPCPDRIQLKVGHEQWDYPPHHLTRFSRDGIISLLNRSGFKIRKIVSEPITFNIIIKFSTYCTTEIVENNLRLEFTKKLPRFFRILFKLPLFMLITPVVILMSRGKTGKGLYIVSDI